MDSARRQNTWLQLEPLEPRCLLAVDLMSPVEHHVHELVNWIRANPADASDRYLVELNSGLSPGTITDTPKQPLARNDLLREAVSSHLHDMQLNNFFSHTGSDQSSFISRIEANGITQWQNLGENLAWGGNTAPLGNLFLIAEQLVAGWFASPDHRKTLMKEPFKEVGTRLITGPFTQEEITYNAAFAGQNFAIQRTGSSFVTGAACETHNPRFAICDVSRPIVDATVTLTAGDGSVIQVQSGSSGQFDIAVADGTYDLRIEAEGYDPLEVPALTISEVNVQIDFIPQPETPWHNKVNRLDVNSDLLVTAIDALVVINSLNAFGPRVLDGSPDQISPRYYDTSGDNELSPGDVLLVINHLNGVSAEGELAQGDVLAASANRVSPTLANSWHAWSTTENSTVSFSKSFSNNKHHGPGTTMLERESQCFWPSESPEADRAIQLRDDVRISSRDRFFGEVDELENFFLDLLAW